MKPYRLGLSVVGPVFLVLLFAPNILWAIRKKPEGYAEAARRENRLLALLERVGEVAVTAALLLFKNLDPVVLRLSGGTFFSMRLSFLALSLALMLLYEGYWIRYFRSPGTLRDFYSSFAGFPVAGATLPVIAALLLGIYAGNWILIGASLVLAVGHIGIHLAHRRELAPAD
ncbi:MAG: hypothetical protein IJL69_04500 [Oscillospiraceae bacterium]|nr:hypothetical protein [Oscillospiraceae bacterium]